MNQLMCKREKRFDKIKKKITGKYNTVLLNIIIRMCLFHKLYVQKKCSKQLDNLKAKKLALKYLKMHSAKKEKLIMINDNELKVSIKLHSR